jgi:oligosaccharide repeat unit polymerase
MIAVAGDSGRRQDRRRLIVAMIVASTVAAALVAQTLDHDLLAFSAWYVCLALCPLWFGDGRDIGDVFRPYYGVALLLYLYSVSTPLLVADTGVAYFGEAVDPRDMTTYYIACLCSIAGLSVGTIVGFLNAPRPTTDAPRTHATSEYAALMLSTAIIALITASHFLPKFNPGAATSYAAEALALRIRRLADTSSGITETMLQTVPSMLVIFTATIWLFHSRRVLLRAIGGAALVLYMSTSFLSGWRGELVVGMLVVGMYVHYRVRRFTLGEVVVGGALVYLLVNGLALVRVASDPRAMWIFLQEEISTRGFAFLRLGNSGELATSSNLLRLISGIRVGESSYGWGMIGLGQFLAFVPRVILPGRPDMASEHFVKVFYPGIFESGGGYGFFMVQDGYWDFGVAGAFAYSLIFAFGFERVYRGLRHRFDSDLVVFLYALLYSQLALAVVRSGIIGSIKSGLIATIPALIPFALSRLRLQGRPERGTSDAYAS